jgi:hypothetical protein
MVEIIGAREIEDLLGYDTVGATLAQTGQGPLLQIHLQEREKTAIAVREASSGTVNGRGMRLVPSPLTGQFRRQPMGIKSLAIAAGATVPVTLTPKDAFRPERLSIPSDLAGYFVVSSLMVGNSNEFATSEEIPARLFQEDATEITFGADTCPANGSITFNVKNTSSVTRDFRAALVGIVAK